MEGGCCGCVVGGVGGVRCVSHVCRGGLDGVLCVSGHPPLHYLTKADS